MLALTLTSFRSEQKKHVNSYPYTELKSISISHTERKSISTMHTKT